MEPATQTEPTPEQHFTIAKVYYMSFRLWVRHFPMLFLIAAIMVTATSLFAYYFFAAPGATTLTVSIEKSQQNWYWIPVYVFIPYLFLAMMYRHLYNTTRHQGENRKPFFPYKRIGSLFMAMVTSIVVICVGLLLFLFPGIIFAIILQFYLPIIVLDDLNWYQSFKQACDLVWGHWWRTAFIVVLPATLFFSLYNGLTYLPHYISALNQPQTLFWYSTLLNTVTAVLSLTFTVCVIFTQLHDLKARKNDPESGLDRALSYYFSFW